VRVTAAALQKPYSLRPFHQFVLMRIDFSHQPPGPLMGEVRLPWDCLAQAASHTVAALVEVSLSL